MHARPFLVSRSYSGVLCSAADDDDAAAGAEEVEVGHVLVGAAAGVAAKEKGVEEGVVFFV